jgi:hypothetical protein
MSQTIRYTILALAIAALPGLVAAQTYGDKAQQPSTTTTPGQTTMPGSSGTDTMNAGTSASAAYQKALAACDRKPADQQQACRDAADAKFSKHQGTGQSGTSAPQKVPSNKQS